MILTRSLAATSAVASLPARTRVVMSGAGFPQLPGFLLQVSFYRMETTGTTGGAGSELKTGDLAPFCVAKLTQQRRQNNGRA